MKFFAKTAGLFFRRRYISNNGSIGLQFVSKAADAPRSTSPLTRHLLRESNGARRIVGYWFVASAGLVFGIVVLGGLTRLTESGLSMVDWSLVHFKPPQGDLEWSEYFEKYKQFPEYQL